jgi:diadenosine tetraphosphate (Ap4A) HIT family hydrolase
MLMNGQRSGFELDARLGEVSEQLMRLELSELRLVNDRRWPWLLLVPQRKGAEEIHDMAAIDQMMLAFETSLVAKALKAVTGCEKINSAALGNMTRQLHVHVVARSEQDCAWPGPIWGHGASEPYDGPEISRLAEKITATVSMMAASPYP